MALEAQKVVVQFRGLETKVDEKQAVPGDLVLLENVRFDTIQEMKKRFGFMKLDQTSSLVGKALASFKRELLVSDGRRLYGYTPIGLVDKGAYEPLVVETQSIAKNSYTQQMPDSVWHPDGVSVFAWESIENGVTVSRYSIIDSASGQPVVIAQKLGNTAIRPKPVVFGSYVFLFYVEPSTGNLLYLRFLASSPFTAPVAGSIASGATGLYDAAVGAGQIYVAYATAASTIHGMRILSDLTHGAATSLVSSVTPEALTVFNRGDDAGFWISYGAAGSVYAHGYTTALASATSNHLIDPNRGTVKNITGLGINITGSLNAAILFYECYDPMNGTTTRRARVGFSSGVIEYGLLIGKLGLAAKAFQQDPAEARFHVPLAYESSLQSTYFVAMVSYTVGATGFSTPVIVAKLAPGVGGGLTKRAGLGQVTAEGNGSYRFAYLQTDRLISTAGGIRTQTGVQGARLTWNVTRETLELGDTLLLTGGILYAYDGSAVSEHGFHLYPENTIASGQPNSIVAGDPTQTGAEAGTYQVCVIYEWMDNFGLLHQSAPSPVVAVEAFAGQQFNYSVQPYPFNTKNVPVVAAIFRTKVNQNVFFRVTSISSPLLNDPTAVALTFSEAIPDDTLSANSQLLANPLNTMAEVPALPSDAPKFITRYRNRAIVIPSEAPGQWAFSKAATPGVPIEFNPQQFYNPVQGGGVPLNSAIEMDDKLILFGDDRIYWTAGDGPAPNGIGSDYGNAFRIPADVGCSDPHSLVLTPSGIMFRSAKGIYLLGRDLSVQYIGASVERYNDIEVTSALLSPGSRRVIFTLAETAGTNIALVYDYFVQKWAVWTRHGAVDSIAFEGLLTFLKADGTIYQETPGEFSDDGSRILIKARTSWLAFAGLSGFQRVWRFILRGSYRGAHKLLISVAFDDNPAPAQNVEVNAAQVLKYEPSYGGDVDISPVAGTTLAGTDDPGGGRFANYEWQVKLLRQKTTSVQVTISEAETEAPNEGLSISVLTFLVGMLPKLKKVSKSHNLTSGTPVVAPTITPGGGGS